MSGLMNNPGILVSIFLFASAAFAGTVMLLKYLNRNQMAVERRVRKLSINNMDEIAQSEGGNSGRKRPHFLDKLSELGFVASLAEELLAANIMVRAEEYLTIWFVLAVLPALLTLLFTGNVVLVIVVEVLFLFLPLIYIQMKKRKKKQQFDSQLGDALLMMSNCLSGGLSFPQAMESIAREMPEPISGEFARVNNEIRFGKTMEQALNDMIERNKSQDLMIALNAVLIQHQVGGNLAEILATLAETVKDRIQIGKDIRVLTSQGRLSGTVIALLPVLLMVVISVMNPSYMSMFFTEQIGQILLAVGFIMEIIGYMLIQKVVDIKY